MESSKRRKDLTLTEKVALLERYDRLPEMSQRSAALKLEISQPLLCRILKNREDIESKAKEISSSYFQKDQNVKEGVFERALKALFAGNESNGINEMAVWQKARELALQVGKHGLVPDDSYRSLRKKDDNVMPSHLDILADQMPSMQKWIKEEWPKIISDHSPNNIYKLDQTVVHYRALPSLNKDDVQDNNELAKKRLLVLCCFSMSGKKRRLSVIGKNDVINSKELLIDYFRDPNPTLSSVIFSDLLKKWDNELKREILLLVEKSSTCVTNGPLNHIRILSLSAEMISLIQPSSSDVTKELKTNYRNNMQIKTSKSMQSSVGPEEKYNIHEILSLLGLAWDSVSKDTIQNSFNQRKHMETSRGPQECTGRDEWSASADAPLDMSVKKSEDLNSFGCSEVELQKLTKNKFLKDVEARDQKSESRIVNRRRQSSSIQEVSHNPLQDVDSSADQTNPRMMLLKRKHEQVAPQVLTNDIKSGEKSVSLVPPIRQTASIFKQSVTIVKPQKSTVRNDIMFGVQEKPKQLFWEKRLQGLTACDVNGQMLECFELPKKVRAVGLQLSDDTLLRSIATALHLNNQPITGQNKPKPLLDKNPGAYINPGQPLVLGVHVTDEDILEQEKKVENARRLLKEALDERKA